MPPNFKKSILLTGAGFSKNFGGLLSREMWSKIFAHFQIKSLPNARKLLQENFDFEDVYSRVINEPEYADEKEVFQKIIYECFTDMDRTLECYRPVSQEFYKIQELISLFAGSSQEIGMHFTLNQDLFLERQRRNRGLGLGGLDYKPYWEAIDTGRVNPNQFITLPNKEWLETYQKTHLSTWNDYNYVKLHGSLGWKSSDGRAQIVLGTNKPDDIVKEPLLNWYFKLFKEALFRPGVRILCIGYGFRDQHINDILLEAIGLNDDFELFVISPESAGNFKERTGEKIWSHVRAYFPFTLNEIFPTAQDPLHFYGDILKFFPKR